MAAQLDGPPHDHTDPGARDAATIGGLLWVAANCGGDRFPLEELAAGFGWVRARTDRAADVLNTAMRASAEAELARASMYALPIVHTLERAANSVWLAWTEVPGH